MMNLLFPRWRKKNRRFDTLSWAVAFAIAIAVGVAFQSVTTEQKGAVAMIVCFASRLILSFILNRFFPDSVVGAVRVGHNEIDWEFRKLFKNNAISFNRRTENKAYHYEFSEHDLRVTLHYRGATRNNKPRPITQMRIDQFATKHQSFVDMLTSKIDELVDQPPTEPREAETV